MHVAERLCDCSNTQRLTVPFGELEHWGVGKCRTQFHSYSRQSRRPTTCTRTIEQLSFWSASWTSLLRASLWNCLIRETRVLSCSLALLLTFIAYRLYIAFTISAPPPVHRSPTTILCRRILTTFDYTYGVCPVIVGCMVSRDPSTRSYKWISSSPPCPSQFGNHGSQPVGQCLLERWRYALPSLQELIASL